MELSRREDKAMENPNKCSESIEWPDRRFHNTTPPEHPKTPNFNQDFHKMIKEFRDTIRRRQPEEWD